MSAQPPKKSGNLLFFVAVGTALVALLVKSDLFSVVADEFPIEGTIVSVEALDSNPIPRREAVVQFEDGAKVRASVPAACIVFPGQLAKVSWAGGSLGMSRYSIISVREKP
jgi:hypothetical protein